MKHKRFFALILTIILGALAVIVTRQINATPTLQKQNQSQTSAAKEGDVPDHIFYGEVFSIIANVKNVRDYQERSQLSDEQTELLRVTAEQCAEKIAKQDAFAETRIAALRQQNLQSKPTRTAPPVPAEIADLQAQRNAIILHCRDVLRAELGNEKFEQFRLASKTLVQIRVSRVR